MVLRRHFDTLLHDTKTWRCDDKKKKEEEEEEREQEKEKEEERKEEKRKRGRSYASGKLDNALTREYETHGALCIQFEKKNRRYLWVNRT